ncbi:hypothetical protein KUL25_01490 [Rhodobacteraceae bacterium N5(2021)]|uniref:Transmembrane protein n=1 Tax=Gymnodinialimonas phycosphaerae TaxID=2841589 RepID=A0A975YG89_9RHOB|nr:hypothetical protein [Gymnodinialimonas phycosphaerae]MBY4891432.1 hypothetical protein [Gymnodinialimonas phycosphaerae]
MIPTLAGRLQTRLFLFVFIGLPVTLLFGLSRVGWQWDWATVQVYVWFLCTITGVGLLLDPLYIFVQSLRWERDWPFLFQAFFAWVEFAIALFVARAGLLPFLPEAAFQSLSTPVLHFALVFVPTFLALLGPMQVLFVRWHFKGGQLGRF